MNEKLSVKQWISNIIKESEHDSTNSVPDLSIDNIESILKVIIEPNKAIIDIKFITKDKKKLELKTKSSFFYNWLKTNSDESKNVIFNFLTWFLKTHKTSEINLMSEIVDEYNSLIGDEDLPKNSDRMIGLSSTDTSQSGYQTTALSKNNFNTGAISGFISW